MQSDDRPAALLTQAQRKYLRGEKEYRPSVERDVRSRIRERFSEAINDFSLILSSWDGLKPRDRRELNSSDFTDVHTFILRRILFGEKTQDEHRGAVDRDKVGFLQTAIQNALERTIEPEGLFRPYEVDVEISIEEKVRSSVADLEQKLQKGEISVDEIRQRYGEGQIDTEAFRQLTRDHELLELDSLFAEEDNRERRREELLAKPVPMLEGDIPDSHMKIRTTNPATKRLHDREFMPRGYQVVFSEDDRTAIVRKDVGEALLESETLSGIERVGDADEEQGEKAGHD